MVVHNMICINTLGKYGSLRKIKDAIKAGADVNMRNIYGHGSHLIQAVSKNSDPEVITVPIEASANVNDK